MPEVTPHRFYAHRDQASATTNTPTTTYMYYFYILPTLIAPPPDTPRQLMKTYPACRRPLPVPGVCEAQRELSAGNQCL